MNNKEVKQQRFNEDVEDTIDLLELARTLLSKWRWLALFTVAGMLIAGLYSFFVIKPTYTATAKLYVVSSSGDTIVDLTDLNIGTSLTKDYQELIMSYPVLDQVISALNLDMNSDALAKLITLSNPANTRVLSITVKTTDPDLSANIANTLAGVAQEYLPETMSTVRPNVAQVARRPYQKAGPSNSKNAILGGVVGFALIAGILTVRFITDDTIRTAEDVEKWLEVPLLTSIPENEAMHLEDKKTAVKSGSRKRKTLVLKRTKNKRRAK